MEAHDGARAVAVAIESTKKNGAVVTALEVLDRTPLVVWAALETGSFSEVAARLAESGYLVTPRQDESLFDVRNSHGRPVAGLRVEQFSQG